MTDAPKPEAETPAQPKARRGAPPKFSEEERALAFKLWLDHDCPGYRQLAELFMDATGKYINFSTLHDWACKNEVWAKAIVSRMTVDPERVMLALKAAKADANQLEADHFMGVKAQLVARLYESVQSLPLSNVEDWNRALDCCDRLEALIHTERGKAVAGKGDNVAMGLMERLAPNVSIAPFKKANGNGSTNGAGGH